MARICQLVWIKFELLFGDRNVTRQHDYIHETAIDIFGILPEMGYTKEQLTLIHNHLSSLHTDYRLAGIEEYDKGEIRTAHAWEQYVENFSHKWVESVLEKIDPSTRLALIVVIPGLS